MFYQDIVINLSNAFLVGSGQLLGCIEIQMDKYIRKVGSDNLKTYQGTISFYRFCSLK